MDIGRSGEMTNMRLKELKKPPGAEEEINALKYNKRAESEKQRKPRDDVRSCRYCSGSHRRGSCPAYGKHARIVVDRTILPKFVYRRNQLAITRQQIW